MKKRKYNLFLTGGLILLVTGYSLVQKYQISKDWLIGQTTQKIQEMAEYYYLPFSDSDEANNNKIWEEIWTAALDILPIGSYVFPEAEYSVEDTETYELFLKLQERHKTEEQVEANETKKVSISLDKIKNQEYLINKYYTVDSVTYVKESDFDVENMLEQDLRIDKTEGPKILIFHTHSQEKFADSDKQDDYSIVDAGGYLAELLEQEYQIETLHHKEEYDLVNGKLDRSQAYERARPQISEILEKNPSIEIVIDLHRDGVGKSTHLVTEIDGKETAQIMFFNGLCRTRTNGDLEGMGNPYLQTNLAFSLQMKITAEACYPGFTRRNYLKGYKYNMDLAPRMLLIEAGAQTNTVEEIQNAMEPLAEILHLVGGY